MTPPAPQTSLNALKRSAQASDAVSEFLLTGTGTASHVQLSMGAAVSAAVLLFSLLKLLVILCMVAVDLVDGACGLAAVRIQSLHGCC